MSEEQQELIQQLRNTLDKYRSIIGSLKDKVQEINNSKLANQVRPDPNESESTQLPISQGRELKDTAQEMVMNLV